MARGHQPCNPSSVLGGGADSAEIIKFDRLASRWWDESGPMAPLHKLNPTRLAYLRDRMADRLGRDPLGPRPLAGIAALDVGCGGGLVTEPLARLGARVTGIDLAAANVEIARRHAAVSGLDIDYRMATAETLAAEGDGFDLVCCLEVVEHVPNPAALLTTCARLVRPGGALVLSTLNRTARAFALGIVTAEYVLGWLPRGTHRWSRFVRPSEAAAPLRRAGLTVRDLSGVVYDPLVDRFRLSRDLSVNYMLFAVRERDGGGERQEPAVEI
jgi:2-polyprenyl-6-hydroxyphenyl methylase/3-demethylubiquinone-9 3-methyltransferase